MALSRKPLEFSASVISTSISTFFESLPRLEQHGINRIHVDVMDGVFVPRFGLYPELVREIRGLTDLPIDVHMMIQNPEDYVSDFVAAGASRITPHLEPVPHVHRLVQKIREAGAEAGLALNPHTDFASLRFLAPDLSVVTLMAINPGIVGHAAIASSVAKVEEVRAFLASRAFDGSLEVDGGVTFENVENFRKAGADTLVVGAGTIFNPSRSVEENLAALNLLRTGVPNPTG